MKRRVAVVAKRRKTLLRLRERLSGVGLVVLLGLGGAACAQSAAPTAAPASLVPTRTLFPPTATPTPLPLPPSPTELPGPATLRPLPSATPGREQTLSAVLARTLEDLTARLGQSEPEVRLLTVEAHTWEDATWGCAQPAEHKSAVRSAGTRGYRIVYAVNGRAYVYHTDRRGAFFLCQDRHWLALEGEPIALDPIAEALVARSRQDAARRLGVEESDVQLVSLLALVWPDASLGCPRTDADYPAQETSGYRIVLRAPETTVIYHTDAQAIVFCAPEEELLPAIVRRALPPPTPTPTP